MTKLKVKHSLIQKILRARQLPKRLVNYVYSHFDEYTLEDIPNWTNKDLLELRELMATKSKSEEQEDRLMELQFLFAADSFRDKVID